MKKLEKKTSLVLVKYYLKPPALVRYCTGPSQTNPNNRYQNDNKSVLKIPLVLTLSRLGLLNINQRLKDDPVDTFSLKIKKAAIWNIMIYPAIRFHQI